MIKNNKKTAYIFLSIFLIIGLIIIKGSMPTEGKHENINVYLNGQSIAFRGEQATNKDGIIYVPLKEYSEIIGAKVDSNSLKNKLLITKKDKHLVINTKKKQAITDENTSFFINVIGKSKNKLIPLEVVSNYFDYDVKYEHEKTIVKVTDKPAEDMSNKTGVNKYTKKLDDDSSKVAYLTFDDGPNVNTNTILDILKENNAKATFFMLGSNISDHKDLAKRIHDEGHALGVHSVTHNFKSVYASPESFLNEMNSANEMLFAATGKKTLLMRAPYGSKPYMKQPFRDLLISHGYRIWDWDIDSRDSIKKHTSPNEVYNNVVNQLNGHNKPILLFHDRDHTVRALPKIIEYLKSNGYEIKKLEENIEPMNFWKDIR